MKQVKNIAIIIDSLTGGGAEKVMITLAQAITAAGHNCHILSLLNRCVYSLPKNCKVHYCFDNNNRKIDSLFNMRQSTNRISAWIDKIQAEYGEFDLFLSNLNKTNQFISRLNISPVYYVIHSSIEQSLKSKRRHPIQYWNYKRAIKIFNNKDLITVSSGIESEIINVKRIRPKSIQTILNPSDIARIRELSLEPDSDRPNEDYLIHIGRVARVKRHDILFSALSKTKSQIKLVVLCKNIKKAQKIAKKYGVLNRVIIIGFKSNPYPLIRSAKCLILSSEFEGLPTVLIEALACGIPVISTNCDHGPSEILQGELSNWLVPINDSDALANKIDEVLKHPPEIEEPEILDKVVPEYIAKQYLGLTNAN